MVDGFPYEVPEEYKNMPLLKGRAAVDMKVKVKDNPNLDECVFHIVLDGYNAPVTAGNFVDLVERHFYDGMEIQRGIYGRLILLNEYDFTLMGFPCCDTQ